MSTNGRVGPGEEVRYDPSGNACIRLWECRRCQALVDRAGQAGHAKWHYTMDVFHDEVYRRVRDLSRSPLP